jgi:hypothetical protein
MFARKSHFARPTRFRMERLESRQLMARDTGAALDHDPIFEIPEPPTREPVLTRGDVVASAWRPEVRGFMPIPVEGNPNVGDITATLLGGNLYLGEATGQAGMPNGVSISRLANGNILLVGHDPTNSGGPSSRINGMASMEFAVTGSLFSNLGNGENQIVFDPGTGGLPTFGDIALNGGADADRYIINGLVTRGSASFNTGAGDDWVFVSNSLIGDGLGFDQLWVNSGAGSDTVTVKNGTRVNGWIDIQTYDSLGELDGDVTYFDTEAFALRDVNVRMGGGDDIFLATKDYEPLVFFGALQAGSLTLDMGDGADTAFLRGVKTGGDLKLFTGAGGDTVTIDSRPIEQLDGAFFHCSVGGNLEVQTYGTLAEIDRDVVTMYDGRIHGSLLARLGGGNDAFSMTYADYIFNDLDLNMGDGDDTADVAAYVTDHLMLWMGEGNDTLNLGKTWAYRLIADGGVGYDSLWTTSQTKSQYRDQFSWERVNGFHTLLDDIIFGGIKDAVLTANP